MRYIVLDLFHLVQLRQLQVVETKVVESGGLKALVNSEQFVQGVPPLLAGKAIAILVVIMVMRMIHSVVIRFQT